MHLAVSVARSIEVRNLTTPLRNNLVCLHFITIAKSAKSIQRAKANTLFETRVQTRIGLGNGIRSFEQMDRLLSTLPHLPPDPRYGKVLLEKLATARRDDIWLVDTEFVTSPSGPQLLEIGLLSLGGKFISQRVLPTMPLEELRHQLLDFCGTEGGRGLRPLKAFDKFFGRPVPDNEDPPIPLGDAILLIQRCGYGNKSIVLEWSWSCCDCSLLQDSALQVDLEVNMPLKQNCISLLHAFRALMPGVFTWALSDAYPLFFDDILQHHSHRALVDAIKTANMMLKYLSLVDSHVAHGLHEAVANAIRSASSKGIY